MPWCFNNGVQFSIGGLVCLSIFLIIMAFVYYFYSKDNDVTPYTILIIAGVSFILFVLMLVVSVIFGFRKKVEVSQNDNQSDASSNVTASTIPRSRVR